MGAVPSANNKAASFFNLVIDAFMQGGEAAVEAYITSLAPEVFAWPLVNFLMKEAVSYFGSMMSVTEQKFATKIVIDIQTHGEKSSVITSATALQFAISAGNPKDIQLATENAANAWGNLIHWDGSAQPKS